ncbi:hypothetical protein Bphy_3421 [Paraburkholderia phymatum STM815]|uniref:Uncharacterized protein n=1 Tax=Paraburkholderia phymatum (strain DSM 17167 / CIP 108236 / LMG 21445 / STM815) TaxID=391038 RepID=B2JL46_PARP8|nr:hypothetical protein Bphy_3421 [Paraburkholderia phymatum STM815]
MGEGAYPPAADTGDGRDASGEKKARQVKDFPEASGRFLRSGETARETGHSRPRLDGRFGDAAADTATFDGHPAPRAVQSRFEFGDERSGL